MAIALLYSCQTNNDDMDDATTITSPIYFVGDSLIERWDLQQSFPALVTINNGLGGSGIAYLESMSGMFNGKYVVILTGTNDFSLIIGSEEKRNKYATRYLQAIHELGARRVWLISVLPRRHNDDPPQINSCIRAFNNYIRLILENEDYRIEYIDVHDLFIRENNELEPGYFSDGVHLTETGYEVLANAVRPIIYAIKRGK